MKIRISTLRRIITEEVRRLEEQRLEEGFFDSMKQKYKSLTGDPEAVFFEKTFPVIMRQDTIKSYVEAQKKVTRTKSGKGIDDPMYDRALSTLRSSTPKIPEAEIVKELISFDYSEMLEKAQKDGIIEDKTYNEKKVKEDIKMIAKHVLLWLESLPGTDGEGNKGLITQMISRASHEGVSEKFTNFLISDTVQAVIGSYGLMKWFEKIDKWASDIDKAVSKFSEESAKDTYVRKQARARGEDSEDAVRDFRGLSRDRYVGPGASNRR